jgi:hypothetical protein
MKYKAVRWALLTERMISSALMGDERIVRGNMSQENWKDGFYPKNKQGTVSQEFLK